jgi:hypothetical protein
MRHRPSPHDTEVNNMVKTHNAMYAACARALLAATAATGLSACAPQGSAPRATLTTHDFSTPRSDMPVVVITASRLKPNTVDNARERARCARQRDPCPPHSRVADSVRSGSG